jgi:hypothetical protein
MVVRVLMDAMPLSTKKPPSNEGSVDARRWTAMATAGLLLWLLAAWPLVLVKNLPHEDLPGHVAAAYVVDHLAAYPEYVAAHGLRTNSALLSWLHAGSPWLGYMQAARVFVIAVLAITAFGYAFLFSALGGSRRMWIQSLFAVPLVHHWFVSMGMLNFSLSFGLCLWILGLLAMQRSKWDHLRAGGIAVLCALAWIAHSFPLLMLVVIALADLAYARSFRWFRPQSSACSASALPRRLTAQVLTSLAWQRPNGPGYHSCSGWGSAPTSLAQATGDSQRWCRRWSCLSLSSCGHEDRARQSSPWVRSWS